MERLSGSMVKSAFAMGVARKASQAAGQMALKLISGAPRIEGAVGADAGRAYEAAGGLASPSRAAAVKGRNLNALL